MFVYPERMKANLESTKGLVFSGQLLLDLVEHGVSREEGAYRMVQGHAHAAWKQDMTFTNSCSRTRTSRPSARRQVEHASTEATAPQYRSRFCAGVPGNRASRGRKDIPVGEEEGLSGRAKGRARGKSAIELQPARRSQR